MSGWLADCEECPDFGEEVVTNMHYGPTLHTGHGGDRLVGGLDENIGYARVARYWGAWTVDRDTVTVGGDDHSLVPMALRPAVAPSAGL
jgi:hypothetical protein